MELKYIRAESTVKPSSIEYTKNSVYLHRNYTEEVRDGVTFYIYEEACLTPEEFKEYSNKAVLAGQENGDNNQLIIMEAIADLYDLIATMM